MPDILSKYPKTHIYTTGKNLVGLSWGQKMRLTSYQLYLSQLIEKYGLQKNISFLGTLSADQMCEQYLKANVFVSPSTIENSSNSVGEAMLLGCPVVSSNVGGINNLLKHGRKDIYISLQLRICWHIMSIKYLMMTIMHFRCRIMQCNGHK